MARACRALIVSNQLPDFLMVAELKSDFCPPPRARAHAFLDLTSVTSFDAPDSCLLELRVRRISLIKANQTGSSFVRRGFSVEEPETARRGCSGTHMTSGLTRSMGRRPRPVSVSCSGPPRSMTWSLPRTSLRSWKPGRVMNSTASSIVEPNATKCPLARRGEDRRSALPLSWATPWK
jgi:hypothetical protein